MPPKSTKSPVLAIAISILSTSIILLVLISGTVSMVRRKRLFAEILEDWETEHGPYRISYKNLYKSTSGFKNDNLLGTGGFGKVYRGVLSPSGTQVAIKRISHDSSQGMKEFVAEIISMRRLKHRNLVDLLGYCRRKGELFLVYDYMPNGSLDIYLFNNANEGLQMVETISWTKRFDIIKGIASAILYLHEGTEQLVVHRDIKAGNVLLDHEFNAKLGDFGLARLYDRGKNPQTTNVVGTLGYLAPELSRTGRATTYTDVYALGAFLLEVACGRRPIDMHATMKEQDVLVDWVLECWKSGEVLRAADPRLGEDYIVNEIELVLQLGLLCSQTDPQLRPNIKQVVQILEGQEAIWGISPSFVDVSTTHDGFENIDMPNVSLTTTEEETKAFMTLLLSQNSLA